MMSIRSALLSAACVLTMGAAPALAGPATPVPSTNALPDFQQGMMAMQQEMDGMFRNFFNRSDMAMNRTTVSTPAVDIVNGDKAFVVTAEMPGMDLTNIDATVTGYTLNIKGTKQQDKKQSGDNYQRQEISYGSFERQIALPTDTDPGKARAAYKNGILTVTVPKVANAPTVKTRKLAITQ